MQKGFAPIFILVGILTIALVAGGGYYFLKLKTPTPKACTMEAKLCPDGSSVGRSGPNCEFAPCPAIKPSPSSAPDETANWKIYTNDTYKYTLKVPNDWIVDFNNAKENSNKLVFISSGDFKLIGDTQVPHLSKGSQLEILSNLATNVTKSYNDFIVFEKPDEKEYANKGKEIIIDGERAMLWTSDNAFSIPGQRGYQASVLHHGKGYSLHMISAQIQDTLFNQILSTFKFQ